MGNVLCPPQELTEGMKFAVKSNICVQGEFATAGTKALENARATRSASVVTVLEEAGHEFGGMVGMHELALGTTSNNAVFGPVRNPVNPDHVAGGSSGGSAAAVAEGTVDFALGTDTGGSMRIPAAYCGVVGMRPTLGRYPQDGLLMMSHSRDTVGVFARNVETVADMDALITGDKSLPEIDASALRLGVPRQDFFELLEPEVRNAMNETLTALSAAGAHLIQVDLVVPDGQFAGRRAHELAAEVGFPIVGYELVREFAASLSAVDEPERSLTYAQIAAQVQSPDVKAVVDHLLSAPVPDEAYAYGLQARAAVAHAYDHLFTRYRLDAIIYPTVGMRAPVIGQETVTLEGVELPVFPASIRNTEPGSLCGQPSMSIPVPVGAGQLPIGLGIECAMNADRRMLAVAKKLEQILS